MERRSTPRFFKSYPAMVQGINASGETFNAAGQLDNLSEGGLYLWLPKQRVEQGAKVSIIFWTSITHADDLSAPHVEVQGRVLRTELHPGGMYGVAVAIKVAHKIKTKKQPCLKWGFLLSK